MVCQCFFENFFCSKRFRKWKLVFSLVFSRFLPFSNLLNSKIFEKYFSKPAENGIFVFILPKIRPRQLFLVFHDLATFEEYLSDIVVESTLIWDCWISSCNESCTFPSYHIREYMSTWFSTGDVHVDLWVRVVSARFSSINLSSYFSLSTLYLRGSQLGLILLPKTYSVTSEDLLSQMNEGAIGT